MPSINSSGRKDCPNPRMSNIASWQLHSAILSNPDIEIDFFKRGSPGSDSSASSRTATGVSYGEETCDSLSDEERVSKFLGGTSVPKLSLPTLYEDEENPVTVKITCKKCLDMEAILRNFAQMHVKAFETCKEKRYRFWDFIINWNSKLQKSLELVRYHLIGEFITHIEQAPLSEFKEDHDFRVQFNNYRLLFTHMKSMESRFNRRKEELNCPLQENFNLHDKTLKDLRLKVISCTNVLHQLEQRIRCIAKSWDNARAETNPHGFRQAIFTKEDYIFNRLSNIFTCIDFLERERKFYQEKSLEGVQTSSSPPKRNILPPLQFRARKKEDQCPKPSNVKRLPQNSVKRKLPSAIAHMYPFTKPQIMGDVHASWYRTFLRSEDVKKEINQQRDTNIRVLTDIKQLKKEIHHLETQLKMKEYVDQSVIGKGRGIENGLEENMAMMFPDKNMPLNPKSPTSSFLDFNSLF